MKKLIFINALLLGSLTSVAAEDDLWNDGWEEETEESSWSGFVEYGFGKRFDSDELFKKEETLNELRLFFENDWSSENITFNLKGEVWQDFLLSETKLDFREFNLSFSLGESTDIKVGRQISTWGTGDLVFLNDQFPKNWQGYFNGRDDNYIKAAANAVRVQNYNDIANVDIIWTPKYTPDEYINGERFSFFSPITGQSIGGGDEINEQEPDSKLSNGELAIRLSKNFSGTEINLYGYKGFDKRPLGVTENFEPTFHKRNLYGLSLRGNLGEGLYNFEFVQENALEDSGGNNPLVNNSLQKYLLGYESEWLPKLNVGFQYYVERVLNHNELLQNSYFSQYEAPKYRRWLTNRIRYQAMQDKLTMNLFSFFSISEDEYFLRWNINYRKNDNWTYVMGLNLIDGKEAHTFFNQFHLASNAYFRVRYNF